MHLDQTEQRLVAITLKNSLQSLIDYADPLDYDPGGLENHIDEHVSLILKLGGGVAQIVGKNGKLLSGLSFANQGSERESSEAHE